MHEIDFLPVGDYKKCGDAIAMRFTSPGIGEPIVGTADSGSEARGTSLVGPVATFYDIQDGHSDGPDTDTEAQAGGGLQASVPDAFAPARLTA
jgi:hypothetical protein